MDLRCPPSRVNILFTTYAPASEWFDGSIPSPRRSTRPEPPWRSSSATTTRAGPTSARAGERLALHQHGLAHVNHEQEGRKYEFGPSRPRATQLRDIEAGRDLLYERLDGNVQPIFTPPWNRCTAETGHCLAELGFRVLSREARAEPLNVPGLHELPVRIDWFARRHGTRLTLAELAERIAQAIATDGPVGVMFHHALMDGGDMERAAELLTLVAGHERAVARPMMELV